LNDLRERAFHFSVELDSGVWTALQVPVEGGVVLGGGFVV
jgi:hypothetical protein